MNPVASVVGETEAGELLFQDQPGKGSETSLKEGGWRLEQLIWIKWWLLDVIQFNV